MGRGYRRWPAQRRNPPELAGYAPRNPEEVREIDDLARKYEDWHWSLPARKVIHVKDSLVPNLVAIGQLASFTVDGEEVRLPKGSWLGFDPKHPHERMHVVVPAKFREQLRKAMKTCRDPVTLQSIAESTGGTQSRHKLPNLRAAPVGVVDEVVYQCAKGGDGWSSYVHTFGHEHSNGVKPVLAVDVSGRMWLVGGSARCPLPGITG